MTFDRSLCVYVAFCGLSHLLFVIDDEVIGTRSVLLLSPLSLYLGLSLTLLVGLLSLLTDVSFDLLSLGLWAWCRCCRLYILSYLPHPTHLKNQLRLLEDMESMPDR